MSARREPANAAFHPALTPPSWGGARQAARFNAEPSHDHPNHLRHRGLQAEPLIFETGHATGTGVDLPAPKGVNLAASRARRRSICPAFPSRKRCAISCASAKEYAIDLGLFPLGSCTMKHNPRLNERAARFEGFADLHPLQPTSTIQGALVLMDELAHWLCTLTGMPAVALSPKAGAHGEFCGMLAIKAALEAKGEGHRKRVLVPSSAHGTNPATAAAAGFTVDEIPARDDGRVHLGVEPSSAPMWPPS